MKRNVKPNGLIMAPKFLICPICEESVQVGGPNQNKDYVFQPHSPRVSTKVNDLCTGTGLTQKASP